MAKSAGVDFDDWIAAAIAEYAEDLGVDPRELDERERLEAIEERIDRLARKSPAPPEKDAPARREAAERFAPRDESPRRRDEPADEPLAARRPSLGRPPAPDLDPPDPLEQAVARIERRAQRAPERDAGRPQPRGRLEDAIQEIERRAERSERRGAQALESLTSFVDAHGGENERLQRAIAEVEARAEKTAARTARALESLSGAVEARKADRERLEAAIARIGHRAELSEARAARALESLATRVQQPASLPPAPERDDPVAARLEALARRASESRGGESVSESATVPGADDETFRLVTERLAQRRRQRQEATPDAQRPLRHPGDRSETPAPERATPVVTGAPEDAAARIERQLAGLAERIERLAQPAPKEAAPAPLQEAAAGGAAPDPRPLEELARRVEAIRAAVERQGATHPEGATLTAALANLNDKLDRAASGGAQSAATMTALHGLIGRLEAALQRPAATLDPRPIEELSRRIDGVRGLVERQGGLVPKVDEISAAVGALHQKLPRAAATAAEIERLETGLRQLSADVQALVRAEPVDMRPVEQLGRRLEEMRKAVENRETLQPQVERLESALTEIRARLERPTQNPQIEAVDATLRKLAAKFEEAVSRPAADPRPMEDLSRRIDAVRSVAERGFAPHATRLEAALADIRAQFDRPTPEVDAALRDLAAKIDDAINRPATVSLDPRPIEELARRIESVRESLDKPQAPSPQAERLESALGAVADRLDRAPVIDAQGINSALAAMNARLEEAFRQPPQAGFDREPIEALSARVDAVRESVERQAGQFDVARLEEALRGAAEKVGRPAVGPEEFHAVVAAIQALATKIDEGASGVAGARVEDLLERVADRLDRPGLELADLTAKMDRPVPDLSRLEALMEQAANRLETPGDLSVVAEAISELSARLDRESGAPRDGLLEELVQDVAIRLEGIENKLDSKPGEARPADEGLAHLELGIRDLAERIGDFGGVAQELRALQDRIDDLEPQGALVEQTSQAIARDLAARLPAANPEALLGHLQDIHERLDSISAMRPGPAALEQAMIELTEELEAFRSAREAVGRGAATLSEMRAEQMQFDRRMDARFSGVQEILEKLVEKFDRDANAEPPAPRPSTPATGVSRAAMLEIPERNSVEKRPTLAPSLEAPQIAAQGRGREAVEGNNAKAAAINAHIAAARRAANAAADGERRDEADPARKPTQASDGLAQRATAMFSQHRRPVLLGVAGVMTLLTGVAVLEMRGHAPVRKSELEIPTSPLALTEPPASAAAIDNAPTGSISAPAKVISAPLPPAPKVDAAPKIEPAMTNKPAAALVAALPAGLGGALVAAASNGEVGAEVEIAQRYLEGRGVPRDPKTAAGWMQAAADTGNAFAQYRLGAMYEKGVGIARDAAKARELYKKAASAGNARAMHNLAVLYAQDGGDGKPDYAAAMDWFRKAGAYGVRDSQFNLGVLYGRGLGATQSLAESWMWFSLAARQGDTDAARKREEVENRMDGRALAEARKLLEGFKTKTPAAAANDAPPAPAAAASAPPAETRAVGVKG